MKLINYLFYTVIIFLACFLLYNSSLSGKYNVNQSTVVDVDTKEAFDYINNYKTWENWAPWSQLDPTISYNFDDAPTVGKGASYSWEGVQGKGGAKTIDTEPYKSITQEFFFSDNSNLLITYSDNYKSTIKWKFTPTGQGTKISWIMEGQLPFFLRFITPKVEKSVNETYKIGLESIKKELESSSK